MTDAVPIIDYARLAEEDMLRALDQACRDWGVFELVGHGIPDSVISGILTAMAGFFAQSSADKEQLRRTEANPWGYYDSELTKNTRDWKEVYDYGPADGVALVPQLPSGLPGFQRAVDDYYEHCERVSLGLLSAIATNLGVTSDSLARGFRPDHTSFLRLNYYPPCAEPGQPTHTGPTESKHFGINPHTDAGAMTVLLHDRQSGLQVYREGEWHTVVVGEGSIVINIGDIVQVWSNDRYPAPLHRVLANLTAERYSAPFFFNPAYAMNYAPLAGVVDDLHPARYHPINWGEFRAQRALGDYGDYGEEVQIAQYRVGDSVA